MSYLYIPFTDREGNQDLRRLAGLWVSRVAQDSRHKNPPEIKIHGSMPRVLGEVQASESIYILAHGGDGGYVFNNSVPPASGMDHRELALRVFRDELSLGHRKVKLYFCNPLGGAIAEFARRFKEEMWQLNYTGALEVYYYVGNVSVPREDDPGVYYKTSSRAPTAFDMTGKAHAGRASTMRQRA